MMLRLIKDSGQIRRRVSELAAELDRRLVGAPHPLMLVVLKGAFVFAADLLRAMHTPCGVDFMLASSYGDDVQSSGEVRIMLEPAEELAGRAVVLVDDICDSGRTMQAVESRLRQRGPERLITCALLDKPSRRIVEIEPDLIGFEVGAGFVVGYGLDLAGEMRHLDGIYERIS